MRSDLIESQNLITSKSKIIQELENKIQLHKRNSESLNEVRSSRFDSNTLKNNINEYWEKELEKYMMNLDNIMSELEAKIWTYQNQYNINSDMSLYYDKTQLMYPKSIQYFWDRILTINKTIDTVIDTM